MNSVLASGGFLEFCRHIRKLSSHDLFYFDSPFFSSLIDGLLKRSIFLSFFFCIQFLYLRRVLKVLHIPLLYSRTPLPNHRKPNQLYDGIGWANHVMYEMDLFHSAFWVFLLRSWVWGFFLFQHRGKWIVFSLSCIFCSNCLGL